MTWKLPAWKKLTGVELELNPIKIYHTVNICKKKKKKKKKKKQKTNCGTIAE